MKAFIYPYKPGSESSKALSEALGIKRISHRNSKFKGSEDVLVINWGASKLPEEVSKCTVLNKPEAVAIASNKLTTFQTINPLKHGAIRRIREKGSDKAIDLFDDHDLFQGIDDDFVGFLPKGHPALRFGNYEILDPKKKAQLLAVRTPEYTTDRRIAQAWLNQGTTIVERHVLNGNSGEGIVLVEPRDPEDEDAPRSMCTPGVPLYVKYVPKKQEWRIHVCNGVAVDIQRKARRKDVADEDINWKIRNHDNGFIFARNEGIECPQDVITQAVNAVVCVGLDFGAVDVIFNEKEQQAYVLEINTAPGLSGSTLEGYTERFEAMLEGEVRVDANVAQNAPQEDLQVRLADPDFLQQVFAMPGIAEAPKGWVRFKAKGDEVYPDVEF